MADEASMQGHGQSEAMQAAMSAFTPLVAGPPQMTVTTPVAALGLGL
jgi:quinol monooxygenase YgiN